MRYLLTTLISGTATVLIGLAAPRAQALAPPASSLPAITPASSAAANVMPVRVLSAQAREPIRLERAVVRTQIVAGIAQTRIELELRNPNDRVLEGELQFPLAQDQQLTGFALDIDGDWRPAVPVDKAKGRQVFEDVTRARIDPALLEATQGNMYKLRVYPLPPRGVRRVALQLAQTLAVGPGAQLRFDLPLGFAAQAGMVDVQLNVPDALPAAVRLAPRALPPGAARVSAVADGGTRVVLEAGPIDVRAGLALSLRQRSQSTVAMQQVGSHDYFVADVALQGPLDAMPRPAPRRIALLWDASGSGAARDHSREFAMLDAYFGALKQVDVDLIVGRDRVEPARRFVISGGRWDALREALSQVAYDGASDLSALAAAGEGQLALLFSDGIATWGSQAATPMPAHGTPMQGMPTPTPIYAISAAAAVDAPRLRAWAEASGGRHIDLLQVQAHAAARELQLQRAHLVALRGEGLSDLVSETSVPVNGRLRIAGRSTQPSASLIVELQRPDGTRHSQPLVLATAHTVRVLPSDDPRDAWVAQRWAGMRVAQLDAEIELHREEVRRLGRTYGLATRETSLIVLDTAADYARHDIEPPRALRAEVERLVAQRKGKEATSRAAHLDRVAERFARRVAWWQASYPKDAPPAIVADAKQARELDAMAAATSRRERRDAPAMALAPAPAPAPVPAAAPVARTSVAQEAAAAGALRKSAGGDDLVGPTATIRFAPWASDSPVARRLREATAQMAYRVYLDERAANANSTAFFLDAADALIAKGQNELAVRVLSNLAEMDLDNRHVLRVLGYRLLQAGDSANAVRALREVLRLSPDEPQSHRDLALALIDAHQPQEAAEHLWDVVARPWDARFPDIDLIALGELNALVERTARSGKPIDTAAIDARLLRNLPVDLRITLAWDADNTDIDLWVIDPNGERAYYGHPQTRQGGRMSQDATGGYGPEEFLLRDAKPGRYTVQAQFFGHRQQVLLSATTVMLRLTTGFGRADQKDELTTLRLNGRSDVVTVGTFEVVR